MNSSPQLKLSPSEGKLRAYNLRQKDTGWGRVIAQSYVPFYALYYAITRRTITPWLFAFGLSLSAAFCVGLVSADRERDELDGLATLASLFVTPFAFKAGTDKAREFAAEKLKQH